MGMRVYIIPVGVRGDTGEKIAFLNLKQYLPKKLSALEGMISFFGGAMEDGDVSPLEAALRELKEETGPWFETARLPGYKMTPLQASTEDVRIYGVPVDAGQVSHRLLCNSVKEGAVVITSKFLLENQKNLLLPGVYDAVLEALGE